MKLQTSPRTLGRAIACLFLLTLICGVFAQGFIADSLLDFKSAASTANGILAHRGLFQAGYSVYVVEMVCQIATAALWYLLLRPVNQAVALSAAFIELAASTIKMGARALYIAPLFILDRIADPSSTALAGFSPEQMQSLALVLLRVNDVGAAIAVAMFGFSTLLNGYLIFRSTFLPKWLGALAMLPSIGWLMFIYPPLGREAFTVTATFALLMSVMLIFWLLIRGVDEERWRRKAEPNFA